MTGPDDTPDRVTQRTRALFEHSVTGLDAATRSRLTRARHEALEAASSRHRTFAPVGAVAVAAVLGIALWLGAGRGQVVPQPREVSFPEPLEFIVQAEDAELLGDDPEFYAWAIGSATGEIG